jgi:hypothetical protein
MSTTITKSIQLTTTGTSGAATLVGSTLNIPQYSGGGGLKGVHNLIGGNPTSQWGVTAGINCAGTSFTTQSANNITLYPFIPNKTITSVSLRLQVGTAVAGGIARILVYSDLNGLPNTKLYESANLDCSTTGVKTATTAFTFTAGTTYWLACHTGASINMLSIPAANLMPIAFQNPSASVTSFTSLSVAIGSAPNPYVFQYVNASAVTSIFISVN